MSRFLTGCTTHDLSGRKPGRSYGGTANVMAHAREHGTPVRVSWPVCLRYTCPGSQCRRLAPQRAEAGALVLAGLIRAGIIFMGTSAESAGMS